ncbi:unnamed protein product [Vitrella brassicaformis CCMP3155]|uniref:Uncharacterized protein n=1 Tax=Vitrella brassicaformis (strain CCMP3155) TaxID=1169540 RepID=A0A0G4ECL1_VITBC|nr:unnamed protein product [Vitrella brassicaformis CCMP3155]|eukprot:CEL93040.1 unnamed protein product [Vitrella brassicaformis CCMP3155]
MALEVFNPPSNDSAEGAKGKGHRCALNWTPDEDQVLFKLVQQSKDDQNKQRRTGSIAWKKLAEDLKTYFPNSEVTRSGRQCRERWLGTLDPSLNRGPFTPDEERSIVEAHAKLGNQWAKIAKMLPGRTENKIRSYWFETLSHKVYQETVATLPPGAPLPPQPKKRFRDRRKDRSTPHPFTRKVPDHVLNFPRIQEAGAQRLMALPPPQPPVPPAQHAMEYSVVPKPYEQAGNNPYAAAAAAGAAAAQGGEAVAGMLRGLEEGREFREHKRAKRSGAPLSGAEVAHGNVPQHSGGGAAQSAWVG